MVSGFRQFLRVIANLALIPSLLAMAGVVLSAAPDIVLPSAALAQSVEAQQSFAIEGPTAVEFPENSTAAIATYRAMKRYARLNDLLVN